MFRRLQFFRISSIRGTKRVNKSSGILFIYSLTDSYQCWIFLVTSLCLCMRHFLWFLLWQVSCHNTRISSQRLRNRQFFIHNPFHSRSIIFWLPVAISTFFSSSRRTVSLFSLYQCSSSVPFFLSFISSCLSSFVIVLLSFGITNSPYLHLKHGTHSFYR